MVEQDRYLKGKFAEIGTTALVLSGYISDGLPGFVLKRLPWKPVRLYR